jgi:hypothetical protein
VVAAAVVAAAAALAAAAQVGAPRAMARPWLALEGGLVAVDALVAAGLAAAGRVVETSAGVGRL